VSSFLAPLAPHGGPIVSFLKRRGRQIFSGSLAAFSPSRDSVFIDSEFRPDDSHTGSHAPRCVVVGPFLLLIGNMELTTDPAEARRWLDWLDLPKTEIRKLGSEILAGVFNDRREAADVATSIEGNIYCTVNLLNESIPATNDVRECGPGECVKDAGIVRIRHLGLDIDSERAADPAADDSDGKRAATNAERNEALAVADKAAELAADLGWPEPARIDSGNGFYLFWKVDLPASDKGLIKNTLAEFAKRLGGKVDISVHNPARIFRIPGSVNCKGNPTAARPHRMARIISLPGVAL
jgi:hypothetical protein